MRVCLCIALFAAAFQSVCASDSNNDAGHLIEKRQSCVQCPVNPPACPVCPAGEECQIISQSCTQCAQSVCISTASLNQLQGNTVAAPSSGPNTGAIVGGIVGAIVAVSCLAGGLFWYLRKKRRTTQEMDLWMENTKKLEEEKSSPRQTVVTTTTDTSYTSSHLSIASTTMTRASNVIPIGYIASPLRSTMMSGDSRFTQDSLSTIPSHPPTQFFSADDILRNSLATNRDTRYSDRDTVYSGRDTYIARDSVRDSVGTTYTRASYNPAAIIAPAPVPVAVRGLQPKIVTFGKRGSQPIPAVPALTAEKVQAAERSLAASRAGNPSVLSTALSTKTDSTQGLGLDIPIAIQLATPRASTVSSNPPTPTITTSVAPVKSAVSPFDDEVPESPILGDAETESFPPTPTFPPPPDVRITISPDSPTTASIFDDPKETSTTEPRGSSSRPGQ